MTDVFPRQMPSIELIDVTTTRYSELLRNILNEYRDGTEVTIDGRRISSADYSTLIVDWCTNARISATRDFKLTKGGVALFGFHDHPREFWAALSEEAFVRRLAETGVVHYKTAKRK